MIAFGEMYDFIVGYATLEKSFKINKIIHSFLEILWWSVQTTTRKTVRCVMFNLRNLHETA